MTPSGTTHFVHDLMGNVIAETNGVATGTVREYIWLPETQIAPMMAARAQVDRPLGGGRCRQHGLAGDVVGHARPPEPAGADDGCDQKPRSGRRSGSRSARPSRSPAPPPSTPASPASGSRSNPACTTTGTGTTIRRLGRYTQPDPLGFVDGPGVCMEVMWDKVASGQGSPVMNT